MASVVGVLLATLTMSSDDGMYAVVAPPWYDSARTFEIAGSIGGEIVDISSLSRHVMVVHSIRPDAVGLLYRAGAWLVLRPSLVPGCTSSKATVPAR